MKLKDIGRSSDHPKFSDRGEFFFGRLGIPLSEEEDILYQIFFMNMEDF